METLLKSKPKMISSQNNFDFDAVQLSAEFKTNSYYLSVIAKREYTILDDGKCVINQKKTTLQQDLKFKSGVEFCLSDDTDFYPFKPLTDVIVKGNVRTLGSARHNMATIQVGNNQHNFNIRVFGKRKAFLDQYNNLRISEPEPLDEEISLDFHNAYGGIDHDAEKKLIPPSEEIFKAMPELDWKSMFSPFRYPRNYGGKGFLAFHDPAIIETIDFPNLEDPHCLITPENLVSKNWFYQPMPVGMGWVSPECFPRFAYLGMFPLPLDQILKYPLPEMKQNYLDPVILESGTDFTKRFSLRFANGAHPALQFPYLKGSEWIRLVNIHPKFADFVFQLPGDTPQIWVDGRKGTLKPTEPVIHTVLIEPDENRVSIVWRGCAPALRPYMPEELENMPFKVVW